MFSLQDLFDMIRETDINLALWGIDGTETITHLIDKVNSGTCKLLLHNKTIIRISAKVHLMIYYQADQLLCLHQSEQLFQQPSYPVLEKSPRKNYIKAIIKRGSTPYKTAYQALYDKPLQISIKDFQLLPRRRIKLRYPSKCYPGLMHHSIHTMLECFLTTEQYNPSGYIQFQPDKVTFFTWAPIAHSQPV